MLPPSDPLLRTLAAVSPSSRVLDLGCGGGRHTAVLALFGFDVYACGAEPDDVAAVREVVCEAAGEEALAARVTVARPAALGYPDDFFDWVVAYGSYDEAEGGAALLEMLAETRRVLRPGGWVWVAMHERAVGPGAAPEALTALFEDAGFALAEKPEAEDEDGERLLRGIYRKVDETTTR